MSHTHNHHDTHHCDAHEGHECCHHHDEHHHHCHHHDEHHHHHDEHESTRSQLLRILIAALLLAGCILIEHRTALATWQLLLLYLIPYLIVGLGTLREAAEGILHGQVFNEHFLMSLATVGALLIGFLPEAETQFPEAVFVMLFFQVGELFEGYAEGRSRDSIAHLLTIRPDSATVLRQGQELTLPPDQVQLGETLVLRPGDKVPLDGVVLDGNSALNTVALTGESLPRNVAEGDEVLSGCINLSGLLHVRVTKSFGQSTASRIIQLVEEAAEHKSRSEAFITRFAHIYTPIVVCGALLLALLPPLLAAIGAGFDWGIFASTFATWLYRALLFLVVSCPCALVISVPLSFFGGIGSASRSGILVKGANYIDALARIDTVVFDKTGTLTHGRFAVQAVHPERCDEQRLLHLAAHVEHYSTHPIGAALRDAFPNEATDGCLVAEVEELPGLGIKARVGSEQVCVGNEKLMASLGLTHRDCHLSGTIIHVAIDGIYSGHIIISDQIKEQSADAIRQLNALGIRQTVMLTGDRKAVAQQVADALGIDRYYANLLPADKLQHLADLQRPSQGAEPHCLAFVGDGINDAPVLARADVGIAMGALGSDAAIEAADVVLMDDNPAKLPLAIRIARRTLRIARQNVVFAIGIKVAVLLLAALGLATLWMAVFADVGVTVIAVFNAMRTLKTQN